MNTQVPHRRTCGSQSDSPGAGVRNGGSVSATTPATAAATAAWAAATTTRTTTTATGRAILGFVDAQRATAH
jgi:hypothetical protein